MAALSGIAVPVLLDTTDSAYQLLDQWTRMYHYGHQVLPTMAVATFLLYLYSSIKGRHTRLAFAGLTTLTMVPFTWLAMVPTNNELFRLELAGRMEPSVARIEDVRELVVHWSWLHVVRTTFPFLGAVLGTL